MAPAAQQSHQARHDHRHAGGQQERFQKRVQWLPRAREHPQTCGQSGQRGHQGIHAVMPAAVESQEHREGGGRTQQVGQQEQVQHAEPLRRHDDHRDGQHQHQDAGQPQQAGRARLGQQPGAVHGNDAGDGADGRVGAAHHQCQSQRDEGQGHPGRQVGHHQGKERHRGFATRLHGHPGQAEQPHQQDERHHHQAAQQKAALHVLNAACGIDALPVALVEDAGQQDGHEEGGACLQAAGIAEVQQGRRLLGQAGRHAAGAARHMPANGDQCQQHRYDDQDLHLVGEDGGTQAAHGRVEQHGTHHDGGRQAHRHRGQQRHQHRDGGDFGRQLDEDVEHHDGQGERIHGPAIAGQQELGQRVAVGHELPHATAQQQHGHQRGHRAQRIADHGGNAAPGGCLGGREQDPRAQGRGQQCGERGNGPLRVAGHHEVFEAFAPASCVENAGRCEKGREKRQPEDGRPGADGGVHGLSLGDAVGCGPVAARRGRDEADRQCLVRGRMQAMIPCRGPVLHGSRLAALLEGRRGGLHAIPSLRRHDPDQVLRVSASGRLSVLGWQGTAGADAPSGRTPPGTDVIIGMAVAQERGGNHGYPECRSALVDD